MQAESQSKNGSAKSAKIIHLIDRHYLSMGDEENDKMKNGFNEMTKTLSKKKDGQLVWYSDFTQNADHKNNAEISASVGIRKWTDYLKTAES